MNPKPFSALNHLTVPCAMVLSLRGESDTDPRTVRRSGLVDDFDTFGCKHPWSQARGDILQSRGTDSRTVTGYSLSRFHRKDHLPTQPQQNRGQGNQCSRILGSRIRPPGLTWTPQLDDRTTSVGGNNVGGLGSAARDSMSSST